MPCGVTVMASKPVQTMFVWSSKKLRSVDCRIVNTTPRADDIASAKYTRTLQGEALTIVVIGTGDILSAQTLKELARAFVGGKFTQNRKGEMTYVIR